MQEYIIVLSKYVITAGMLLYTLCGLGALFVRPEKQKILMIVDNFIMFCLQFVMFVHLYLASEERRYVFFYAFVQIFLFAALSLVTLIYEQINRPLLTHMCMLLSIGLCMLSRLQINKAIKQYIIVMISLTISLIIPFLFGRFRFLKKLTWLYGLLGVTMLAVVFALGEVTHGSKISYSFEALGGITFQPSEFVKILFVFFIAAALWEDVSLGRVLITAICAGIHVIILVLSKDLGSALIFFVGFVFIVFIATKKYLYLLAGILGGSVAALIAYRLFDHVRVRVLAWQNPWDYIDNQGYQITQSLFAIGSGSWFGMGLMEGNPKAIPYVEADFIFSAICEEFGVVFGACLILICVFCFVTMIRIALKIHDRFYQMIVYGISVMYIFQIFLTIGGGIKFIPLTGVTLPFISYGGSSVMTSMIMFFIVQGIYIRLQQEGGRRVVRREDDARKNRE